MLVTYPTLPGPTGIEILATYPTQPNPTGMESLAPHPYTLSYPNGMELFVTCALPSTAVACTV